MIIIIIFGIMILMYFFNKLITEIRKKKLLKEIVIEFKFCIVMFNSKFINKVSQKLDLIGNDFDKINKREDIENLIGKDELRMLIQQSLISFTKIKSLSMKISKLTYLENKKKIDWFISYNTISRSLSSTIETGIYSQFFNLEETVYQNGKIKNLMFNDKQIHEFIKKLQTDAVLLCGHYRF